jgi:histidine triad (HIT) family protein
LADGPIESEEESSIVAETVFSKIIRGEIPAQIVYEDEHVVAFLDINPLSRGHTLLVPKEAATTLDELSEGSARAIGAVLPRLCRAVIEASGTRDYNVLQNNGTAAHQAVRHVHFHIIPKESDASGLRIGWPAREMGGEEAESMRLSIAQAMGAAGDG